MCIKTPHTLKADLDQLLGAPQRWAKSFFGLRTRKLQVFAEHKKHGSAPAYLM